ncbi:LUD domain-containing protein [Sorangium atrum]|uniref:LUD domain-containing protein n=1 Tax=Sorangium atrum TaxID=2995308 RepID=UPI00358DCFAD
MRCLSRGLPGRHPHRGAARAPPRSSEGGVRPGRGCSSDGGFPLGAAISALGGDPYVVWCTGPSKTADVEGILIQGVHGPGEPIALIVDAW